METNECSGQWLVLSSGCAWKSPRKLKYIHKSLPPYLYVYVGPISTFGLGWGSSMSILRDSPGNSNVHHFSKTASKEPAPPLWTFTGMVLCSPGNPQGSNYLVSGWIDWLFLFWSYEESFSWVGKFTNLFCRQSITSNSPVWSPLLVVTSSPVFCIKK